MADEKLTEYKISADPSKFEAGMKKTEQSAKDTGKSVSQSMDDIKKSTTSLAEIMDGLTGKLGKITAMVAGGAFLVGAVEASVEWIDAADDLSKALGITTERASVYMVAMRHLDIESGMVTKATTEMTKQILGNKEAFAKLGVSVKDSHGQYRAQLDVMADVNTKLGEIKNPIEQNIAGMQAYGDSWMEVKNILKLTTDELKKAEQHAIDLNLVVGEEGANQVDAYKSALGDLGLVSESIRVQIGAALLPTVVSLGAWFAGTGPTVAKVFAISLQYIGNIILRVADVVSHLWGVVARGFAEMGAIISAVFGSSAPSAMQVFINVLKVFEMAFSALGTSIKIWTAIVVGLIEIWVASFMRLVSVAERAIAMDFKGAERAWQTGTKIIEDLTEQHIKKVVQLHEDGRAALDQIALRAEASPQQVKDTKITGGPKYDFKAERVKEWDAKLEADKAAYAQQQAAAGTAMEYSKAMERDYWGHILATNKLSKEEKLEVNKRYWGALAAIRKEDFDNEIAAQKLALDAYKNNYEERIAIANAMYQKTVARFGAESKDAKAALNDLKKEQRAYADQVLAINKVIDDAKAQSRLAEVDLDQQNAENLLANRRITEERMIDLERMFEERRNQIKRDAMKAQLKIMAGNKDADPVALAQLHAQIEAQETAHQTKLTQIKNKASQQQNKAMLGTYATIQSGMARMLADTAKGTAKMSDLFRGVLGVVAGAMIDMLADMAAQWLMNLILAETTSKVSAISQISANAGVAGAAATASAAAIPVYGWAMAAPAGAAASAAAMGYMSLASARGGFDIPAGVNPITQLHEKEMVLPAQQAQVIRDMADNGGAGGHTIHYHDNSGRLTPAEIRRNAGTIATVLRDYGKKS